jgi:hypothetical protein
MKSKLSYNKWQKDFLKENNIKRKNNNKTKQIKKISNLNKLLILKLKMINNKYNKIHKEQI